MHDHLQDFTNTQTLHLEKAGNQNLCIFYMSMFALNDPYIQLPGVLTLNQEMNTAHTEQKKNWASGLHTRGHAPTTVTVHATFKQLSCVKVRHFEFKCLAVKPLTTRVGATLTLQSKRLLYFFPFLYTFYEGVTQTMLLQPHVEALILCLRSSYVILKQHPLSR